MTAILTSLLSGIQQIPTLGTNIFGPPAPLISQQAVNNRVGNTAVTDTRVRLSTLDPAVYQQSPIMAVLGDTNGMLFPYTPAITFTQGVDYMAMQMVHSNTDYQAYTRTPSVKIGLQGKFTVQNQREGQYAVAVLHFLRTVSKSYFGETDARAGKAGLPPPVLLLTGYGQYVFGQSSSKGGLRVILTNHTWSFDDTVDTIQISVQGGVAKIPALFTVSCDLTVIQTPARMRNVFSFDAFARGDLMQSNDGWI